MEECSSRLHRKAEEGDLSTLPGLSRAYEDARLRLEELLSEWTDLAATP
jgi:O-succinylbenzoate synthase